VTDHPTSPTAESPSSGTARPSLRPVWETALKDPVEDGHLRLKGMSPVVRQVAIVGVSMLVLLLISVLFSERWRQGELLFLDTSSGRPEFLPTGVLPVTLVALAFAWIVLSIGALHGARWVRVIVALLFLATASALGRAAAFEVGDSLALKIGPETIRVAFFTVPGLLLLSCLVPDRFYRRFRWLWLVLTPVAVAVMFMTHLWVHLAFLDAGFEAHTAALVSGSVADVRGLLTPLIFASGLLVIDFGLDVAKGIALSGRTMAARWVKVLLAAVVVVKLGVQLFPVSEWITYVQRRPVSVARTLLSVGALGLAGWWIARHRSNEEATDRNKERLLYGASFMLSVPTLLSMLAVSVGVFLTVQLSNASGYRLIRDFPTTGLFQYGRIVLAAAAVLLGIYLLRERPPGTGPLTGGAARRQLGAGVLLIGAWVLPSVIAEAFDIQLGFHDGLFDILLTFAVAAFMVTRWAQLTSTQAVTGLAIVLFSWVVMTKGDWISIGGRAIGLPEVLIVVFGIGFSLLGDCQFTARSSRSLPEASRSLLWVGYLLLSVTIFHWFVVVHAVDDSEQLADVGYFYLGMPLAAWLAASYLLNPDLEE
jgi:hypothetical protein